MFHCVKAVGMLPTAKNTTFFQANISMINCILSNNDARKDGGVFALVGEGEISVQNSTFLHNIAEQGAVMSIRNDEDPGHVTTRIMDSSFVKNSAEYGGVVHILDLSHLTILNSKFDQNTGISFIHTRTKHVIVYFFITVEKTIYVTHVKPIQLLSYIMSLKYTMKMESPWTWETPWENMNFMSASIFTILLMMV